MWFQGRTIEIRRTDPHRRKYRDAQSEVLDLWYTSGAIDTRDDDCDWRGNSDQGESVARFGRWLLWNASSGAVSAERCASSLEASQQIAGLYCDPEDCPDYVVETWLWQATAYESSADDSEYEPADAHADEIPEEDRCDVASYWLSFLAYAQPLIDQADRDHSEEHGPSRWADDPETIGHDWVLTSYHHGTGFWDRHWDHPYAALGKALTALAHSHSCPELSFTAPDGWFVS